MILHSGNAPLIFYIQDPKNPKELEDFLKYAERKKYLKEQNEEPLESWQQDPDSWKKEK